MVQAVVHAAVIANHREAIVHPDAYLFKAILREVGKRLRGNEQVTYVGTLSDLEFVKDSSDAEWAKSLVDHLFIQEFTSAMDDEAREVYFKWAKKDSWEEIAKDLGCSVQSAKDRLRHGILRAKRRLLTPRVVKP